MLKKIYQELVLIRKELQAIRSSKESSKNIYERKTKVVKINGEPARVPVDYDNSCNMDE